MSDNVKFIFKTLFRVPITIMIAYFIFNIFAFSLTYFKLLGLSYVVMQTAVENNYLPSEELNTINNYLDTVSDTGVINSAYLVLEDPDDSSIDIATNRRQYGTPVTVGISANYRFILPLTPKEQLQNTDEGFLGMDSGSFSGFADEAVLEQRRENIASNPNNNINIIYTVPGLKYYPDLN